MISRSSCLSAALMVCTLAIAARAQEGAQPGAAPGAATEGPDKKYVDMSHSKDRVLKATAERYLNLIKFQEWGGTSGKTQMAKYVNHTPDLKRVTLSVAKGTGKERVVKEFEIEVDKLNKTCQQRVKQIDVLQKRLDELADADAAKTAGGGAVAGPEAAAARPAARRGARRGEQGPEGAGSGVAPPHPEAGPGAAQSVATAPENDPSAAEPDPIGFAELPPVVPPGAGPGQLGPGQPGPGQLTPGPGQLGPEGAAVAPK